MEDLGTGIRISGCNDCLFHNRRFSAILVAENIWVHECGTRKGMDCGRRKGNKENQIIEASEIKQVSSASPEDIRYMKEAIRQAKKAAALGDVPIGCVIVYQDKIIGRGYNRRMADKTVLAHAEIIAMRKACKKMGDWRLEDCTMYVTLEPCPMCAGAIVQATDSQSGHRLHESQSGLRRFGAGHASRRRLQPPGTDRHQRVPGGMFRYAVPVF